MSEIADKHLDLESSWSGKVVVDDDSGVYGIQWNGDIITRHETAPHILLHEQLHARSVTKYDRKMYKQYIIGRMGIPYREKGINIISIAIDAPQDVISTLSGKIGRLSGISTKTAYSNIITKAGE